MRRAEEIGPTTNPVPHGHPATYHRMYGGYGRTDSHDGSRRSHASHDEEGVEVVLERNGSTSTKVVDSPPRGHHHNQNVFRPPTHPGTHRPRAIRAPHGGMQSTGSYGYGPPPPPPPRRGDYPPPPPRSRPMQVPYTQSGSFEDNYPPPPTTQHYSPQIHYPTPGRGYQSEDVNVISPNHKPDPYRPPATPRSRHAPPPQYYHYPPTSPVSRPGQTSSPPRRMYGMRRGEGPYSAAQRGEPHTYHPDDGTFNHFQPTSSSGDHRPPLVAESSFDSDNYVSSHYSSHPPTPGGHHEPHAQFYGGESWGSFDTAPPPPHFEDYRYYGYPPESPYSHYSPNHGYYGDQYPPHPYDRPYEEDEHGMYHEGEGPNQVTPNDKRNDSLGDVQKTANGIMLPKAASEIDFEVTNPPMEPVMPPSDHPVCDSPAAINSHDVLCGRGGGTNSQIGNRRFRKLVQEFQPTYLLARRKEKPLLARTIVLIIRKRGGRFLRKDEETGELYEVGDAKAEAKTSQALREGLDVRATKSAANSLVDKKTKKKKDGEDEAEEKDADSKEEDEQEDESKEEAPPRDETPPRVKQEAAKTPPPSPPPSLPQLQQGEVKAGIVHPHSPEAMQFRKRRRMRSGGCIPMEDKLFPDFCPPRADLHRTGSPFGDDDPMDIAATPPHRNVAPEDIPEPQPGCAGIALSIMTGAATGSFCLGPSGWRK